MVDLRKSLGKAFETARLYVEGSSFDEVKNKLDVEKASFGFYYQKIRKLFHHS